MVASDKTIKAKINAYELSAACGAKVAFGGNVAVLSGCDFVSTLTCAAGSEDGCELNRPEKATATVKRTKTSPVPRNHRTTSRIRIGLPQGSVLRTHQPV